MPLETTTRSLGERVLRQHRTTRQSNVISMQNVRYNASKQRCFDVRPNYRRLFLLVRIVKGVTIGQNKTCNPMCTECVATTLGWAILRPLDASALK